MIYKSIRFAVAVFFVVASMALQASYAGDKMDIQAITATYTVGDQTYEGYIAWNANADSPMPGVVIFHQWMGLTDYEQRRARELAELGYFAFAADLYGKGVRPQNRDEASEQAGMFYQDPELFQSRVSEAFTHLRSYEQVDASNLGAMGYCFGGTASLMLAATGDVNLNGIVSFHGGLSLINTDRAAKITCPVLVQHGADDPFVPEKDVVAFKTAMDEADVQYVFVEFANAVHAFTQPMAGNDPSAGAAYNETADMYSWEFMKDFWMKRFGR